ncbi:MAG: CBS domain-containing protein [Rhodothermales bacterium]|nr:CBS domain-containing protein [Rhodothermales bacterium]MBO6780256.1 CBS domain-containing protein [Rhodothermales bacterium]
MGEHNVHKTVDPAATRRFTRQVIQDVRALEYMLDKGMFETGVARIGAEQELFLVDPSGQPANTVLEILKRADDERLVTELTRFNIEFNLDPCDLGGDCMSKLEKQINEVLAYVRQVAREEGSRVVMTGILPTLHLSDLTLENMTPMPRYYALNDAIMGLRTGPAQYAIRGTDELFFQHDNIMVEGCNTSFQTHFQVDPDDFAHTYNVAQLVAAPVLAAAANSPTLFGKRLWRETRIALFQQAVDTRSSNLYLREMSPRVHFGTCWVNESVTELYKEDIARFRVIMTSDFDDPFDILRQGQIPKLKALGVHNGTVYRWNRAIYGVAGGKPHLRIENRVLPSGPSVIDEVANSAFWFGLVLGLRKAYKDIRPLMDFDEAQSNFVAASRLGLGANLRWLDGGRYSTPELITDELIPIAREGLKDAGIDAADISRYLDIVDARVRTRMNGAQWQLESLAAMKREGSTRAERLDALVAATIARQETGAPGHEWGLASLAESTTLKRLRETRVEHYMSTDLFTVHQDEAVDFVAVLMDWRNIRHVVVEDNQHRLVGLIPHKRILRYLSSRDTVYADNPDVVVKDIMITNPVAVSPTTSIQEAVSLMRERKVGALPVVRDGQLVGIITESDFSRIAGKLLDERLEAE